MPVRYQVPKLQLLCIKIIGRPDGVNRSRQEDFPNAASKRREQNVIRVFKRQGPVKIHSLFQFHPTQQQEIQEQVRRIQETHNNILESAIGIGINSNSYNLSLYDPVAEEPEGFQSTQKYYSSEIAYPWKMLSNETETEFGTDNRAGSGGEARRKEKQNIAELILQAHIRLCTFYDCRLDEMRQLRRFLQASPKSIKTLDFLFEGLWLRDGTSLSQYCGRIPFSLSPQKIDPYTFQEIITLLRSTGVEEHLENLSLFLGPTSPVTKNMADVSVYRFGQTVVGFKNLMRLVIHGDATDQLMETVGQNCAFLEYLDVRNTLITEKGILLLLFKEPGHARLLTRNDIHYKFPKTVLNPCCHTLRHLDISTIPYKGQLMQRNRAVIAVCEHLVQTPRRLFFYPLGTTRMFTQLDFMLNEFHNKVMSHLRTEFVDLFLSMCRTFPMCLQQGISHVESRVTPEGDEISFNFYNIDYLVIHTRLENMTIVDFTCYSASACDFFPIDILCRLLPNLKHLKASIKGVLENCNSNSSGKNMKQSNQSQNVNEDEEIKTGFAQLETVTIPIVYAKNTLISLVRNSRKLKYLEVRELFKASSPLNDYDVNDMVCHEKSTSLEVIRFTFPTELTLLGMKALTLNCPVLRIVGDLKYGWNVPLNILARLKISMTFHNFDFSFEYDNIIYPVRRTACKELY